MTVALPYGLPTSSGWIQFDRVAVRKRAVAVGGVVTMEFDPLDDTEKWLIEHAVIQCSSTTATKLRLYEGSATPEQLLDGSDKGNFNVADWSPGLLLSPGRVLLAQWTGASTAAVATLYVQALVFRRVVS